MLLARATLATVPDLYLGELGFVEDSPGLPGFARLARMQACQGVATTHYHPIHVSRRGERQASLDRVTNAEALPPPPSSSLLANDISSVPL